MLQPKKTKYRKMMKGRMKGTETRGTQLEFGDMRFKLLSLVGLPADKSRLHVVQ